MGQFVMPVKGMFVYVNPQTPQERTRCVHIIEAIRAAVADLEQRDEPGDEAAEAVYIEPPAARQVLH